MKALRLFTVLLFLVSFLTPFAQEPIEEEPEKKDGKMDPFEYIQTNLGDQGTVTIYQDADVLLLVKRHIKINEKVNAVTGWRIQIFSDLGYGARDKAMKERKDFMARYPDVEVYVSYDIPNFKVRIGDFRTKNEANKFKYKIFDTYPQGFLVKDMIEFPD